MLKVKSLYNFERDYPYYTGKIEWGIYFKYFKRGELHREDGPAICLIDKINPKYLSNKIYYLEGQRYSKEEWFEKLTTKQKLAALCRAENW